MTAWARVAAAVTHWRSWAIALLIAAAAGIFMALAGSNTGADKPPLQLPPSAESARAAAQLKSLPGGDQLPAILVVSRRDGAVLTPSDLGSAVGPPLIPSQDGRAAVAQIPVAATLSGFALNDEITALRDSVAAGSPDHLTVQVTGGPAFAADIATAMTHANITLL